VCNLLTFITFWALKKFKFSSTLEVVFATKMDPVDKSGEGVSKVKISSTFIYNNPGKQKITNGKKFFLNKISDFHVMFMTEFPTHTAIFQIFHTF
jgi:hypothetical protein